MDTVADARTTTADGFVVCTIWKRARRRDCAFAYEHYSRLADAVAAYRKPDRDFVPHGIFAAKDGLPFGPPLDMQTILSVEPGTPRQYGLQEFCPVSVEHMQLRELART